MKFKMARPQHRSLRKSSGGRYHAFRTKRRFELAGYPAETKLSAERKVRAKRVRGGNIKFYNLSTNIINVTDKSGKTAKTEMTNVVENPANPQLVRRNIITKGVVVETKLGRARVTNRPGQEGSVNGKLL